MKSYVCYTEKEIFNDEAHVLLFNMIASCINSPSDHRIIVELGEERGEKYYMVDFQDAAGSNEEFVGTDNCCWISLSEDEAGDPDAMFCGGYTNLLSVLDALCSIVDRGFSEIYTESY